MEVTLMQHMEYNFVANQYNHLLAVESSLKQGLRKTPKDINLGFSLRSVQHDLNMLTPIIQGNGISILEGLENKYGVEFKFIIPKNDKKVLKVEK